MFELGYVKLGVSEPTDTTGRISANSSVLNPKPPTRLMTSASNVLEAIRIQ